MHHPRQGWISIVFLMILFLVSFVTRVAEAGWEKMTSPTTVNLYDVWGSSYKDVFVVGFSTDIFHYNGGSWSAMPSGALSSFNAVWGTSSSDVFVVGSGGGSVILQYNGSIWSDICNDDDDTTLNDCENTRSWLVPVDVWASSASNVYVAGSGGRYLYYNGSDWDVDWVDGTGNAHKLVWGSNPKNIFVLTLTDIYQGDHNNGWTAMNVDGSPGSGDIGIWGSSGGDVYVWPWKWPGETFDVCIHYDGASWSALDLSDFTSSAPYALGGSGANDVFAVVSEKGTGKLKILHWDGTKWTKTDTTNVSDVNVTYINAIWVSSSDVFVVGDYGTILRYDREEPPEPETNANSNGNAASTEEPISTATGELYFSKLDFNLGGPLPLKFGRYYASLLTAGGNVSSSLGNNWMHTFDLSLTVDGSTATVVYYGGKIIEFKNTGSEWELQNSEPTVYQFVESGPDYQLMDSSKNLIFTFDSEGKLARIEDPNGNALTLTYTGDQLDQVTDGLDRILSFTYTDGKLTQIQDDTKLTVPRRSVSFSYTGDNLTGYTDARGKSTTYSYTGAGGLMGLMTSQTRPEGNTPYTQTFDSQGRVDTQSDSSSNALTLEYDTPSQGVTTVTDALLNAVQHTHENFKNLIQQKDSDGETFSITYDANNRRTYLTDRLGDTTSVSYHAETGRVSDYTDALGNMISHTYTAQIQGNFTFYNLTRVDYPDGTSVLMTYDASGNLLTLTDRAGEVWTYTYNARGQVLTATNPDGGNTTFTYNADGTLASLKNHFNNTTTFGYDDYKRLSQITHPDATFRSYTYDNNNHLLTFTDEKGKLTTFTYDDNGNLQTTTDPLGHTRSLGYNSDDRLASVTDPLSKTTTLGYDELQRLETVTNPLIDVATYGYNVHSWLTSVTDPAGKTTTMSYDKEGVISSMTDPLNKTWNFTTDKLGRVTQVTTPLSHSRSRTYDSMGRLTNTTDPLSNTTSYTYDERGNLTGITMPENISAAYTRNALGRITRVTDPNGNFWDRTYDKMGRLTSRTDPLSNTITYSYDDRSRISTVTLPESTLNITYDANGNISGKSYSDGTNLTFTYDDTNRMLTANGLDLSYDERGDIATCNGLTMTRDELGRISSVTLAVGKTINYAYNSRGLVSLVTDWLGDSTILTYGDAGRLTDLSRPNGVTTQYTYDNDGRLAGISEDYSGTLSSISLTRDGAGKITSADRNVPLSPDLVNDTRTVIYDGACQVSDYTYDAMGRLTADGAWTYTWDLASRLASYTENGGTVSFTYDGLGMRLSRNAGGTTREYVWNYALGLPSVSIVREGGSDIRYYVHLPGGLLLLSIEASDNTRRFYHFDEMGTTLFLTDGSGAITDSYATTPYGQVASQTGTAENPFTFMGAYGVMQEEDSGLYYMRARYYNATTASFISRDPVKSINPKNINPYQYASNNPNYYMDPTGLNNGSPKLYFPEWVSGPKYTAYALMFIFNKRDVGDIMLPEDMAERKEEWVEVEGSPAYWGSDECILGLPKSRKETPNKKPPFGGDWVDEQTDPDFLWQPASAKGSLESGFIKSISGEEIRGCPSRGDTKPAPRQFFGSAGEIRNEVIREYESKHNLRPGVPVKDPWEGQNVAKTYNKLLGRFGITYEHNQITGRVHPTMVNEKMLGVGQGLWGRPKP